MGSRKAVGRMLPQCAALQQQSQLAPLCRDRRTPGSRAPLGLVLLLMGVLLVVSVQHGQPLAKVMADMERDYWMSAKEAIDYGIVSRVIERQSELS